MPFTFVHVHDLARAIVLATRLTTDVADGVAGGQREGRIYFVSHPDPFTADDLYRTLAEIFDRRYRPLPIPGLALSLVASAGAWSWALGVKPLIDRARLIELRAEGFVCSVDRIRDALGFRATLPLRAGLEETAAWYREAGWI
jgi:nucleoside-diphosphate-sugar epimerase